MIYLEDCLYCDVFYILLVINSSGLKSRRLKAKKANNHYYFLNTLCRSSGQISELCLHILHLIQSVIA